MIVTGIVLTLVGAIAFVVGAIAFFAPTSSKIDDFQRVHVADGTGTVQFSKPGGYVAYYESPTVNSETHTPPVVEVDLTSASGHHFTLTTPYGARTDGSVTVLTYSNDGHHGIAMYQFDIPRSGTYHVALHSGSVAASDGVVAFGEPIRHSTVGAVSFMLPGVFIALVGVTLFAAGLVRFARGYLRPAAPTPPPAE